MAGNGGLICLESENIHVARLGVGDIGLSQGTNPRTRKAV